MQPESTPFARRFGAVTRPDSALAYWLLVGQSRGVLWVVHFLGSRSESPIQRAEGGIPVKEVRRPRRPGVDLTPRDRDVLELVAPVRQIVRLPKRSS